MNIFEEIQGKRFDHEKFELVYLENDGEKPIRVEGEKIKEFVKWQLQQHGLKKQGRILKL